MNCFIFSVKNPEDPSCFFHEVKFKREYGISGIFQIRALYFLGLGLYAAFAVLDTWMMPESIRFSWLIRFGIVMPVFIIAFAYSFHHSYLHYHEILAFLVFFIAGSGITAMLGKAGPNEAAYKFYSTGLLMVVIAGYTGVRIRLVYSLILGFCMILMYLLVAIFIQKIHRQSAIGGIIFINNMFFLVGTNILGAFAGFYFERGLRDNFRNQVALSREFRKGEKLLRSILPEAIAQRLKAGEKMIADEFTSASILFVDIVGFTKLSQSMPVVPLTKMLNRLFSMFDEYTDKYRLEKIKTIGDCYMVASGIPVPVRDHAERIAKFALEIRDKTRVVKLKNGQEIKLRFGIHSGRVAAGIIGKQKFIYDVWGDTVNIASRMESTGVAGEIQVSEETCTLLEDSFLLTPRGKILVKGKGEMTTFLLLREKQGV